MSGHQGEAGELPVKLVDSRDTQAAASLLLSVGERARTGETASVRLCARRLGLILPMSVAGLPDCPPDPDWRPPCLLAIVTGNTDGSLSLSKIAPNRPDRQVGRYHGQPSQRSVLSLPQLSMRGIMRCMMCARGGV